MLQVAVGRRVAAALAVVVLALPSQARAQEIAQQAPQAANPLDPSAPLDPMLDLGVEWPDMEASEDIIPELPDATAAEAASERSYVVRIEGLEDVAAEGLVARFNELSTLRQNDGGAANAAQIERRATEDAELLGEVLRSYGYYDSLVETQIEAAPAQGGPIHVVLQVTPGPLYTFSRVELPGLAEAGADAPALQGAFGVAEGEAVAAADVLAGEQALRIELGERGYPFAEIGDLEVTVDHASRTATLTLPVEPNRPRQFGEILIQGEPLFSADHIARIARFQEGQRFEQPMVDDLRKALIATGLVSTVEVRPVPRGGTDVVDLAVELQRAPLRTIAGEIGYGTGEGFRIEGSWQHRNLIRPEGAVTFRGVAGTQEQLLGAILRMNNFRERDQVLTAQVVASSVDREAYQATSFLIGASLERQTNIIWQKQWTWSIGADLIATDERDVDIDTGTSRRRTFFIGALPTTLGYDGSNDLLDPTRGYRLSARVSPEVSFQDVVFGYTRAQIDGSFYYPVNDRVTVAGRARLGTIVGATRERIAPSRRFYAGGGGSVRGYGYQQLGPRDPVFDDPIGGRSLAEFSIEARVRTGLLGGALGFVPFLDAGNIYTSEIPGIDDLRLGAGIGVRYHTNFGPIRIDVGTPLTPRDGDPKIAVYVSLGQAF